MKFTHGVTYSLIVAALMLGGCAPQAAATPDAMMVHETPSAEAMMMHDTPTADTMMDAMPTADAMATMPEPSMSMADWLATPLTDAASGQPFKVADFHGKVVLVETMAVWCTNCRAQQEQIRGLDSQMMEQTSDLVAVSLDIDPNEDSAILKKYVGTTGFDWKFAVAPPDLIHTIGASYGDQFLNPPSTPMLILDRHGVAHPLPFGLKSSQDLMHAVQPYLEAAG
jgi:cytochrome oxidase Cu insertion factor (SCO1/SenC/PrrC family)